MWSESNDRLPHDRPCLGQRGCVPRVGPHNARKFSFVTIVQLELCCRPDVYQVLALSDDMSAETGGDELRHVIIFPNPTRQYLCDCLSNDREIGGRTAGYRIVERSCP